MYYGTWTKLQPTTQKSFYGKANVYTVTDPATGEVVEAYLKSYDTIVCSIELTGHVIRRHWDNYSATTMKHINDFLRSFDFPTLNKKQWEETLVQRYQF